VYAALHLLTAMDALNTRLEQEKRLRLAVRIGIHTGPVVVGEMGGGDRHERLALGETPNIAARLEGLATPATVVISDITLRLVEGYFTYEALGAHTLKGVAKPMPVYRIVSESGARSRLEAAMVRGLTPLVGREQEAGLLLERWGKVQEGRGQVVVLSGEAGIGKSRLLQVLQEHVAGTPHIRLACYSAPYYHQSALYPLIDLLERELSAPPQNASQGKLEALEQLVGQYRLVPEEAVPLLANMLSIALPDGRYPSLQFSPQQQRQKTLEVLLSLVLAQAEQQPVLFLLEDLHWTDPSTLEWLDLLIEQCPTVSILTLLTCRPEFQAPWGARSYLTPLTLQRFTRAQIETMVQRITGGKTLSAEVMQHLAEKSDGVPLYVEEMTKAILESGVLCETNGHYALTGPLTSLTIPTTLQDSLMARLDRLGPAKGIAQLGATIGRLFSYALLQVVSPLDDTTLQVALARLVNAELVYQRSMPPYATYMFKHALIQDMAYQSLLKSTRQQVHQQIAQVLEGRFPALVATQPELVAQHYTAAGCAEPAVVYWQRAGQQASNRSAHVEAVSHFTTGIELLKTLPETPEHTQQCLTLHIALGAALQITKGYAAPEVEQAFTQARALCHQVGETPQLAPVLFGLWGFYTMRPQLHTARELGDTLLRLAQHAPDPALSVAAHYALGLTWLWLGALSAARRHLKEAIARYTPDQRRALVFRTVREPGVTCRAQAAVPLWLLGYPDQALARLHDALALAHELAHPYSLAQARLMTASVAQLRRDVSAAHEHAEAAVALSTEQGFPFWAALGTSLRGWALTMQGQGEAGQAQVRQGFTAYRATGAALNVPYLYTMLAEVSAHLSHTADSLQALAEAQTLVEQHEERWWEAEVCRLRGVLLLRQTGTPQAEAETWLLRALDVARRQEARSLELRAAMSLARLWQQQGKRQAARDLLAPIYNWFTEGFDTADLQEAKALLDELASQG
jgi:predicted ATPase